MLIFDLGIDCYECSAVRVVHSSIRQLLFVGKIISHLFLVVEQINIRNVTFIMKI